MSFSPSFSFFLADEGTPVAPGSRLWQNRLPLRLADLSTVPPTSPRTDALSFGDYFLSAADFLSTGGGRPLAGAVTAITGKPVSAAKIDALSVFLEKHGAFYHPSRVQVRWGKATVSLVLNVAVTDAGRRHLQGEFFLIRSLYGRTVPHLPRLFCSGIGRSPDGRSLPMFLGEWFDGFFEFHLTGRGDQTMLWDPKTGPRRLSHAPRRNLYRGVARVLAETYDMETGGRVHPWHHGAGDFICRDGETERVDIRLITVRGYPAPIVDGQAAPGQALRELIVYFLHLSMRTRLDRADGTGDLLWADGETVEPTLVGFAEGLADRSVPGYPGPLSEVFLLLMRELAPEAMDALAEDALEYFGAGTEEDQIARRRWKRHLTELSKALDGLFGHRADRSR